MSITNIFNGIQVECFDEGLDDIKNPAKVIITDKKGNVLASIYARKSLIQGADGGWYNAVTFEQVKSEDQKQGES